MVWYDGGHDDASSPGAADALRDEVAGWFSWHLRGGGDPADRSATTTDAATGTGA